MALYRAVKNLVFSSLGKSVIVDETIELDKDYAEKVNEDLKLTFPDVPAVLVPVDEGGEPEQVEKPKRSTRSRKTTTNETAEQVVE